MVISTSHRFTPGGAPQAAPRTAPSARRRALTPLAIGAAVAAVSYIGAGIPSYWGDEAASVLSAQRSLPSLLQQLSAVDAVHGIYYALLHVWMDVFGTGEWATRALSSLAIGFLAAGAVTLGSLWFDRRTGIIAGLLIAVIPRATSLAIETRGYAITAAGVVWLTVLFTHLLRNDAPRRRWILFGIAAGVSSWFFLYLLLVPLAMYATVILRSWFAGSPSDALARRRLSSHLLAAAGATVVAAGPILALAAAQRGQVGFLAHRGYVSAKGILVTPWFSSSAVAIVLWTLIVLGVLAALRSRSEREAATLAVTWLIAPAVALLAVDVLIAPTYNPRYLSVSVGAVALLAARGLNGILAACRRHITWSAPIAAALLAVIVLGVTVPQYLHQRTPYAKDGGADFRFAAQAVEQHAHVGDAVLFGEGPRPSRTARLAYRLYPQDFEGLMDPQLSTAFEARAGLWDELHPVAQVAPELTEQTVWLLESKGAASASADRAALRRAGYSLTTEQRIHRITIYEFTKGARHE